MSDIACVGAVIFNAGGRLLLVKRANPPAQGTWSIPGGRVEAGESDQQAVVREVLEETGLQVSVVREVGTALRAGLSGDRYVIRDFLCALVFEGEPTASDDAEDAMFIAVEHVSTMELSPGLAEALIEWGLLNPRVEPDIRAEGHP